MSWVLISSEKDIYRFHIRIPVIADSVFVGLKGNWYTFREDNYVRVLFASLGSKFLRFRVASFSEGT